MPSSLSPIVVLDSGLGGLTVVRSLRRAMPREDILYFGDTARLPYGTKTAATVTTFVRQIIAYLRPFDPKHVVIACNTATALALPSLQAEFHDLSISGVVEPGARAAVAAGEKESPVVGVIATEATIRSRAYEQAIRRRREGARLLVKATPLLVSIIEEGREADDPLVELALKQYLSPLMEGGMQVLVLGCTHYPILRQGIERLVTPKVKVIDSADECAEDVVRRLQACGMLRGGEERNGWLRCYVTDDSPRFAPLAERFLGQPIEPPTWVAVDELTAGRMAVVVAAEKGLRSAG